jgi:hypothetical protein
MDEEPADDDFVRFDPTRFDPSINELGVRLGASGYVWLTKYSDVKDVKRTIDLEQMLFRQNEWEGRHGFFNGGATLRVVRDVDDAVAAGRTNVVNGLRQWRISRTIRVADLAVIKQIM